jgi:hypothetical protein
MAAMVDACSAEYFKTLGLRLLRGRALTLNDIATRRPVTVINQTFELKFFGTEDTITAPF